MHLNLIKTKLSGFIITCYINYLFTYKFKIKIKREKNVNNNLI